MKAQKHPTQRSALHGLMGLALLSLLVFSACEVPKDPFKDGQEQEVHDKGMYPDRTLLDTTAMDRMDTATNPSMDGKP